MPDRQTHSCDQRTSPSARDKEAPPARSGRPGTAASRRDLPTSIALRVTGRIGVPNRAVPPGQRSRAAVARPGGACRRGRRPLRRPRPARRPSTARRPHRCPHRSTPPLAPWPQAVRAASRWRPRPAPRTSPQEPQAPPARSMPPDRHIPPHQYVEATGYVDGIAGDEEFAEGVERRAGPCGRRSGRLPGRRPLGGNPRGRRRVRRLGPKPDGEQVGEAALVQALLSPEKPGVARATDVGECRTAPRTEKGPRLTPSVGPSRNRDARRRSRDRG